MWTIGLLKRNAWNSVKNYYWIAFGVCLLGAVISGTVSGSTGTVHPPVYGMLTQGSLTGYAEGSDASAAAGVAGVLVVLITYIVMFLFCMAISAVIYAFLSNPIEAGTCSFFRKARNGDVQFVNMFDGFTDGRYMATVKIMFWRMLYTWLWSLLFVIPGIIKGLEYTLIPYLIMENPHLSKDRAFEISRRTMNGEKGKLFLLQLSFIGWYLLGILTCGFGIYFILPYQNATMAEFYACMRAKMLAQGIATEEELSGLVMA